MSAAERASEANMEEQASDCAVRANEQTEERMASYLMPRYSACPLVCIAFTLWLFPAQLHAKCFAVYPAWLFLAAPTDKLFLVNRVRLGSRVSALTTSYLEP